MQQHKQIQQLRKISFDGLETVKIRQTSSCYTHVAVQVFVTVDVHMYTCSNAWAVHVVMFLNVVCGLGVWEELASHIKIFSLPPPFLRAGNPVSCVCMCHDVLYVLYGLVRVVSILISFS